MIELKPSCQACQSLLDCNAQNSCLHFTSSSHPRFWSGIEVCNIGAKDCSSYSSLSLKITTCTDANGVACSTGCCMVALQNNKETSKLCESTATCDRFQDALQYPKFSPGEIAGLSIGLIILLVVVVFFGIYAWRRYHSAGVSIEEDETDQQKNSAAESSEIQIKDAEKIH